MTVADHEFRDWLDCPECGEQDEVSVLGHGTEIVFECYRCGTTSEYTIVEDVPLRDLDPESASNRTRSEDG